MIGDGEMTPFEDQVHSDPNNVFVTNRNITPLTDYWCRTGFVDEKDIGVIAVKV